MGSAESEPWPLRVDVDGDLRLSGFSPEQASTDDKSGPSQHAGPISNFTER
jgi:hypothetical protein